ncbi:MAG: GNAT family N-acetyltransferase [Nocardioides sp.]|nr:GNAT family N-acetyltransferase [Nocardioides sp.]
MSIEPEPHPDHHVDAAHGLGPHVVGKRVVVRRLLRGRTGPSGGPAMTDLLGVCLSWGEGVCVVRPETGPPVEIPTTDIVSGKPVPPRPSPRLRVSPEQAQRRGMSLFPDLETEPLGGWTLRHSPSHAARRANSVLAMADLGTDPEQAYARVLAFYAERGRRAVAAVLPDTVQEQVFLDHEWGPESRDADTVFEVAGVSAVRRMLPAAPDDVELVEDGALATVRLGGRASGVAVVDGDWAGYRTIAVDPQHRRQGLALAVMSALMEWSAERGATTAYLQVLGDNEPALRLYEGIGFAEHHRYRYLAAPRPA